MRREQDGIAHQAFRGLFSLEARHVWKRNRRLPVQGIASVYAQVKELPALSSTTDGRSRALGDEVYESSETSLVFAALRLFGAVALRRRIGPLGRKLGAAS